MIRIVSLRCTAGHEWRQVQSSDQAPAQPPCGCGAPSKWFRVELTEEPPQEPPNPVPYAFVRGRPYELRAENTVWPQGYHYGVSDEEHNRRQESLMTEQAHLAKAWKRGRSKDKANCPEYLGAMSGEMVRSIGIQEHDPSAVAKDPVTFLKKTGRYVGE